MPDAAVYRHGVFFLRRNFLAMNSAASASFPASVPSVDSMGSAGSAGSDASAASVDSGRHDRPPAGDCGAEALVQRFWSFYQARRWAEAQALLAPHAECLWWATQERFRGAPSVVHVNAVYPEGWSIHLLDVQALKDGRVLSLVRVDQDARSFYANSYFHVRDGLIQQIDEYWSDVQAAPAWRRDPQAPLPGATTLPPDRRCGLPLTLREPATPPSATQGKD